MCHAHEYRERAERLRRIATQIAFEPSKKTIEEIAEKYDQMAIEEEYLNKKLQGAA